VSFGFLSLSLQGGVWAATMMAVSMKASPPRSDRLLLSSLITSNKLTTSENKAFRSMLEALDSGQVKLSPSQRMWAEQVYEKLKLDEKAPPANLVKSKTAKAMEKLSSHPYDEMIKNRPLKPPGKK